MNELDFFSRENSPESLQERKTKIVCTIGPSSETKEKIEELIQAGMDVARLNFSHGSHAEQIKRIELIRESSEKFGKYISILQDLQGPKIRTGKVKDGPVVLKTGDTFSITTEEILGDNKIVSTSYPQILEDLSEGQTVLINDGLIRLKVRQVNLKEKKVICLVEHGGLLDTYKGINIPEVKLKTSSLTKKDREDLQVGLEYSVDYVALSFVREAKDILNLREILEKQGKNEIKLIAKIEKPQALEEIEQIIEVSDGIMVARGDLGVEMNPEKVPVIQKQLIKKANQSKVIVITATQMLESMVKNPSPTRAEASDVANAIFDGTDAVMLSGETANGDFPVLAAQTMARIAEQTEKAISYPEDPSSLYQGHQGQKENIKNKEKSIAETEKQRKHFAQVISRLAVISARELAAKAIVVFTASGISALRISKNRPSCKVFAYSLEKKALSRMGLFWGIQALKLDKKVQEKEPLISVKEIVRQIDETLLETKNFGFQKGDTVVITAGSSVPIPGTTSLLKFYTLGTSADYQ